MPIAETQEVSKVELWHIEVKGQSFPYASRFLAPFVIQCKMPPSGGSLFLRGLKDHFTFVEKDFAGVRR